MTLVVEIEIPALPEFVGVARMAVAALAGVRPGLAYDRVDDLRIVVSEACTSAVEAFGTDGSATTGRVQVRCLDEDDRLEVHITGPAGAFEGTGSHDGAGYGREFRISLMEALVDEAAVRSSPAGSELRLVLRREPANAEDH